MVHHDLTVIKILAVHYAKTHRMKYNVVIMNPNAKGEFDALAGSTYEIVLDSAFKENTNLVKVTDTDILQHGKNH